MKKIVSCILIILFMSSSFSVSVYGLSENPIKNADKEINPIQFWLYKQVRKDKSKDCVVNDLLVQLGLSDEAIALLSLEQIEALYNGRNLSLTKSYFCLNEETGETVYAAEEQQAVMMSASTYAYSGNDTKENNWASITVMVSQDKNDLSKFLYFAFCQWKHAPVWRGRDHIVIYPTQGSISASTATATFSCVRHYTNKADILTLNSDYNYYSANCSSKGRVVAFYDDLPGDTPVIEPSPGLIHTDFISVISVYGTNVSKETFNVTAEYYHQFMTIGITPSIDIDTGVSASISPKIECSSIDVNLECKPA